MIDILVPVLDRPQRVAPLLENISAVTFVEHRVLFLASVGDKAEIQSLEDAGAEYLLLNAPPAQGQYAKKINLGFRSTDGEWLLLVADDVRFQPGWAEAALRYSDSVISTYDRGNSLVRKGLLAVHPLIRRSYIEERGGSLDGPGSVYHEGYSHNFVDCELSVIARNRGVFTFARNAIIQHLHHGFGKSQRDWVYDAGARDFARDHELFCERMSERYPRDQLVRLHCGLSRQARRRR